jgi:heptosyltransferase-3
VRSILVVHVSRIGDTLLATPALRAIAAAWPQARIHLLGHPKRVEVMRHLHFLDRVGCITKTRARLLGHWPGRRYDLAFVFGHDAPLIRYALRTARRVVAFRQNDERLNRRLYRTAPVPGFQTRPAVHNLLALLEPLGLAAQGLQLSYTVTAAEQRWAARELQHLESAGKLLLGLQVASFPTKAYRDWPLESFMALCERISARHPDAHFLIFGGKQEAERTLALHRRLEGRSTHYAGRLTLRQTAALMNRVRLYIGVDTGPTHIMGALGRPMVALYHGHSPSWLLAPMDHPCLHVVDHPNAGPQCTPDTPMRDISVDAVWAEVCEALDRHVRRSA